MKRPVIFLDKDGTLVKNVPYNVDPGLISLYPGAADGLKQLSHAGYRFVVVTNQSGVARGLFPEAALIDVEKRIRELVLAEAGVPLAGFYYCPHHPDGGIQAYRMECACRKPKPGMLIRASRDLKIDLRSAWMIGDILDDIEAGRRAGCRTVLLNNGNETEWKRAPLREPHFIIPSFAEAASIILNHAASRDGNGSNLWVENSDG
jgi:D-glycero-D-manno-heptose 1,7-bisphosphate phosphatase